MAVRQRDTDMDFMPLVGARIYLARTARGMTLETLGKLSRTLYKALWTYEAGTSIPNTFASVRIAKVLDLDVVEMFTKPANKVESEELARRKRTLIMQAFKDHADGGDLLMAMVGSEPALVPAIKELVAAATGADKHEVDDAWRALLASEGITHGSDAVRTPKKARKR